MPATILNPFLLFALVAQLSLALILILFWRRLRREQQRHIHLAQESNRELKSLQKRLKSFDREIVHLIKEKIHETFEDIPSISEQLGEDGQGRLKKLLEWQEREIKREEKLFVETLRKKSLESSQLFNKSLEQLTVELKEIVSAALVQAAKESGKELRELQKQRIEELAGKTESVILKISKQVLHKSIDLETQQELLMKALQEAWDQGILSDEKQ